MDYGVTTDGLCTQMLQMSMVIDTSCPLKRIVDKTARFEYIPLSNPKGGLLKIRVDNNKPKPVCQFCQSEDLTGKPVIICSRCRAITHDECIKENGGCPTPGCAKSMKVVKDGTGAPVCHTVPPAYVPTWRDAWQDFERDQPAYATGIRHFLLTSAIFLPLGIMAVTIARIYERFGAIPVVLILPMFALIGYAIVINIRKRRSV